jgi:hypothetical protein
MDPGRQAGGEDDPAVLRSLPGQRSATVVERDRLPRGEPVAAAGAAAACGNWSLASLQQRLVKTGGRLIRRARYDWLLPAEGHLARRLFGAMIRRGPGGAPALPAPAG